MKDTHKTQVLFRYWRGEIIALFPYLIADYKGNVTSYMHIGQHGGANYSMIMSDSKPAIEGQYEDLFHELSSIGYNLEIVKRRNYDKYLDAYREMCYSSVENNS